MKYDISSNLVMDLTGNTDLVDTKLDLEPFDGTFLILRAVYT
jgi:hypothetical protein